MNHIDLETNGPVATLWLNRPEVKNALNPDMIRELTLTVADLSGDPSLRAVVVRGRGGAFSSGADLNWLLASGSASHEQNVRDSRLILEMMESFRRIPVPLISVVEGPAYGGALGILGCSDWVLTDHQAQFAFSEVRLGLAPAVIMPYVLRRTESILIKQLMLTGRRFSASEAIGAGLADLSGSIEEVEKELGQLLKSMLDLPVGAIREIKSLWNYLRPSISSHTGEITVNTLTALKQSTEAKELLDQFVNRKK